MELPVQCIDCGYRMKKLYHVIEGDVCPMCSGQLYECFSNGEPRGFVRRRKKPVIVVLPKELPKVSVPTLASPVPIAKPSPVETLVGVIKEIFRA